MSDIFKISLLGEAGIGLILQFNKAIFTVAGAVSGLQPGIG
jgi:hypothetical protein